MRPRAVYLGIFGFAACWACSLSDTGDGVQPGQTADSGVGGSAGLGGGTGGGTGGGIPEVCSGKCKGPNKSCVNDVCNCKSAMDIDTDSDPHSATCEARIVTLAVTVGITHDWIGHLTLKLWSPTGTLMTLMSRPGFQETRDDGSESGTGAAVAMVGGARIKFGVSGSNIELVGGHDGGATPCQGSLPCAFAPFPDAAGGPQAFTTAFGGERWSGTWKLCAGDSEAGVTGTLDSFQIDVTTSAGPKSNVASGLNVPIPDNGYDGTEGSMGCATLDLAP